MPDVIAITGATGLIGRHLTQHLLDRGDEVRALVRRPEASAGGPLGLTTYVCDLPGRLDPDALAGARVLIHCSYATRATEMHSARLVNEGGTRRILESARAAGVEKVVFVSSIAADPSGATYYARSKYALEQLQAPDRDLNLRPGLVLASDGGLFARLANWVRTTRVIPVVGGGRQLLQTVHIDDLCRAVVVALEQQLSGVLTVASSEAITFRELLLQVAALSGRRCVLIPVPVTPVLRLLEVLQRLPVAVPASADNLRGLMATRWVDTSLDLARLGIRIRGPRESLEDIFLHNGFSTIDHLDSPSAPSTLRECASKSVRPQL